MKKKIIALMFFTVFFVGCNSHDKQETPNQVLNTIVENDYQDSKELCHKTEKDYYAALLESENEVSLVILKKDKNNEYKFFGSSKYSKDRVDYGIYEYGDDNTLVIVFSINTEDYTDLSLRFKNLNKNDELLTIENKNIGDSYIVNFFILPSDYSFIDLELEWKGLDN